MTKKTSTPMNPTGQRQPGVVHDHHQDGSSIGLGYPAFGPVPPRVFPTDEPFAMTGVEMTVLFEAGASSRPPLPPWHGTSLRRWRGGWVKFEGPDADLARGRLGRSDPWTMFFCTLAPQSRPGSRGSCREGLPWGRWHRPGPGSRRSRGSPAMTAAVTGPEDMNSTSGSKNGLPSVLGVVGVQPLEVEGHDLKGDEAVPPWPRCGAAPHR